MMYKFYRAVLERVSFSFELRLLVPRQRTALSKNVLCYSDLATGRLRLSWVARLIRPRSRLTILKKTSLSSTKENGMQNA